MVQKSLARQQNTRPQATNPGWLGCDLELVAPIRRNDPAAFLDAETACLGQWCTKLNEVGLEMLSRRPGGLGRYD